MNTNVKHSSDILFAGNKSKDNHFEAQLRRFREFLIENTVTCTMACEALGIPQKNATWYKRQLEDGELLVEVFKAPCKHTNRMAAYLSTNPTIVKEVVFKTRNQLKLFSNDD